MKYIYLLVMFSTMLFAYARNDINCEDVYKDAWEFYFQEEQVRAQNIIDGCTVHDTITEDGINVLQGMIYVQTQEYKKALEVLEKSRERVIERFNNINKQSNDGRSIHNIKVLYFNMISNIGYANTLLGNYDEALKYFYLTLKEDDKNTYVWEYMGVCYYHFKEYEKSIEFLKKAYTTRDLSDKATMAFSLASVYAIMGDIDNSIQWLDEPLHKDYIFFKKQIQEETDFDNIRNTKKFSEYLNTFK